MASCIAAWRPGCQLLISEHADALAGRPGQLLLRAACCWTLRLAFPLAPWLSAPSILECSLDRGSPPTCSTNHLAVPYTSKWQEGAHGMGVASAAAICCSCTTTSLFAAASAAGAVVFAPLRGVLQRGPNIAHAGVPSGGGSLFPQAHRTCPYRLVACVTTTVSSCTDAAIVAAPLALVLLRGVLRGDWSRLKQQPTRVNPMRHQVLISMDYAHFFERMSNTS
jgi:hypothetical protein